jgi:tRNA modification GTPase
MDLTRVEGLADLIDAETEAQRRQALRQLGGSLSTKVEAWREGLLHALALLEASLDFADEGDVPAGLEDDALRRIRAVHADIGATLDEPSGERLREGFTVVIAGPPNAGKSTLLNALARRDVAIVSPIAGTTRDLIEVRCDIDGLPVLFVDTAGLRDSEDPVEQAGVDRARKRAADADLILWLVPPEGAGPPPEGSVLSVAAKADLRRDTAGELAVSAQTGLGMPDLIARIADLAQEAVGRGDAVVTRERHYRALREAEEALGRGLALAADAGASELVAEDVRLATRAIGQITGRVDVEDVLDRLFSSFCIGK